MWGYGPQSGMMYGGYGYGYGAVHMVFWGVILIAVIVAVVWLVRTMMAPGGMHLHHGPAAPRSAGLAVLEERYARGEINRDEYLQKKGDLLG